MSKARGVKPGFFRSERMAEASRDARLLAIGMWTEADDAGRGRANPRLLRAAVFPLDDIPVDAVQGWLDELALVGHIDLYEIDGRAYYQIRDWAGEQSERFRRYAPEHPCPHGEPGWCATCDPKGPVGSQQDTGGPGRTRKVPSRARADDDNDKDVDKDDDATPTSAPARSAVVTVPAPESPPASSASSAGSDIGRGDSTTDVAPATAGEVLDVYAALVTRLDRPRKPRAYQVAVRQHAERERAGDLAQLLEDHPTASAVELADLLLNGPRPDPVCRGPSGGWTPDPDDEPAPPADVAGLLAAFRNRTRLPGA